MTWIRTRGLSFLLALGLSFALWVFVSFSENPDTLSDPYNVPITVVNLSDGLVMVDQNGLPRTDLPTVDVVIMTDERTLARLRSSDLQATVMLNGLGPGEHVVPVEVRVQREFSRRVRVQSADPRSLNVRLDQLITRTVPLNIEVQGNPPFSFERGNPRVNGRPINEISIQVRGPENRVDDVVIAGATANVNQLSANYSSRLQLQALDANNQPVEGVELEPATVNVTIPIRSVVGLKRVPIIANVVGIPASGHVIVDIQSDPPLINLTGSSGTLEEIDQVETSAVDIDGATGIITSTVELRIPPGTLPQAGEPREAIITIRIEPLTRPIQVRVPIPVTVIGAGSEVIAVPEPLIIHVELSGSADAFLQFDTSTLVATVDVSGLSVGTYTLTPQVDVPASLRIGPIPDVQVVLRDPPRPTVLPDPPTPEPLPTATPPEPTATPPEPTATPESPLPTPTETPISPVPSDEQAVPEPPVDMTPANET